MTRARQNALPTYLPQAAQRSEKRKMGYLPVAGPSGAVKTGPTYLFARPPIGLGAGTQGGQIPRAATSREQAHHHPRKKLCR